MMDFKNLENEWRAREKHINEIGFVRLSEDLIQFLVNHGPWIEIGAGTGALSQAIRAKGGSSIASDNFSWPAFQEGRWRPDIADVGNWDAEKVGRFLSRRINKGLNLLCSWPEYDQNWCYRAVKQLQPGQRFGYIGEGKGGCTGDDALHDLLTRDFEEIAEHAVERFMGIYDHCWIYKRK